MPKRSRREKELHVRSWVFGWIPVCVHRVTLHKARLGQRKTAGKHNYWGAVSWKIPQAHAWLGIIQVPTSQGGVEYRPCIFHRWPNTCHPHTLPQCDLSIPTVRGWVQSPSPLILEGWWLPLPVESDNDAVLILRLGGKGYVASRHPYHLPLLSQLTLWL